MITGGPGTGKTTTVTRLLSALLSENPDLRVALAAPTGKAAARMTESIRQARERGGLPHADGISSVSFTPNPAVLCNFYAHTGFKIVPPV